MPRSSTTARAVKPLDFSQEIDMFFQGQDPVHQTMRRLVRRLNRVGIPHAVVGGMAVFAHGYRRTTDDLDVLLTPEGFKQFQAHFVPKQYSPHPTLQRRFKDRLSGVTVDCLVTGLFPGSGKPGPIAYPDPALASEVIGKINYLNLVNLITLKLAARRYQDFADVVNLIIAHKLDESLLAQLHQSLHRDFIECLEEKRREEQYEARP